MRAIPEIIYLMLLSWKIFLQLVILIFYTSITTTDTIYIFRWNTLNKTQMKYFLIIEGNT